MNVISGLFDVAGKTALVTGGSRGIGFMIARGLVEAGARVYISARNEAASRAAAAQLSESGYCEALPADLSNLEEIRRLSAELTAREPALHILVNNAGATWGAPLETFPEQGWDRVMDLNVKAIFFLTQQLLPLLQSAAAPEDPARVINVGSVVGIHPAAIDNAFSYVASKAALHHLTRALSNEFAKRHITINAIAPGFVDSRMMAPVLKTERDSILAGIPLARMGSDADMAGTALFLSSRAGSYVTGTVIAVDGGITSR